PESTERNCAENSAEDGAHRGEVRERQRIRSDYRYVESLAEWACALGGTVCGHHQANCRCLQRSVGRTCADETGSWRKANYSWDEANHYDSGTQACNDCSRDSETAGYAAAEVIRRHLSNRKSSFRPRFVRGLFLCFPRAHPSQSGVLRDNESPGGRQCLPIRCWIPL